MIPMVVQHRSATPNDRQNETFSFTNVSGPDLIMHQFAHGLPTITSIHPCLLPFIIFFSF
jgi:hypothetical protein